jgi:WD40 repeat protein
VRIARLRTRAAKTVFICFCVMAITGLRSHAERAALVVQTGHANAINTIAFSPDGKVLATGSHDTTIKLWDVKTGIQFRTLRGHTQTVSSITFDQSGTKLFSGSLDGTIKMWDLNTGRNVRVFSQPASINTIALSPDGRILASGGWDHTIALWDVDTAHQLRTLRGHSQSINSVAFSFDGKLIASGSDDNSIRLWQVSSGKEVRTIAIKSASEGSNRFVDINTGKPISAPRGAPPGLSGVVTDSVNSVSFSPDGTKLASLSLSVRNFDLNGMDLVTKLWDVKTGKEIRTFETFSGGGQVSKFVFENPDHNALIGSVSFSTDGTTLIGRSADYKVKLWDVSSGKTLREFPVITFSDDPVKSKKIREQFERITWKFNPHLPTFSPDGKLFAIVLENNVLLWDVTAQKSIQAFGGQANSVEAVAFDPEGKILLTAGPALPTRLWDLTTGRVARSLDRNSFPYGAMSVAVSARQRIVATASPDVRDETATIELWDLNTGNKRRSFSDKSSGEFSIAFSPDGRTLAVGRLGDVTSLWDTMTGDKIRDLGKTYFRYNIVAFSTDGKTLARTSWGDTVAKTSQSATSPVDDPKVKEILGASGSVNSRSIDLWDVETGSQIQRITEPGTSFYSIGFSPDGSVMAAAGTENRVDVWNIRTSQKIGGFPGRDETFYAVAFSPDGRFLAGGGTNGWIYLWDVATGKEISVLDGHSAPVRSIAFDPGGNILASGSDDGTVKLWDVSTSEEIATLVATDRYNYVTAIPGNYYTASKAGFRGIAFRINNRGYPFEQFDLKFNRPDAVLQKLGKAPQSLIQAYRRAYQKRLQRLSFTEEMLGDDFHLPEVRLIGSEPPSSITSRILHFRIRATDSQYHLDRLNIYVNDVPMNGSAGISFRNRRVNDVEQDIEVELSEGHNKIQVSILNERGVESLKETFNVAYTGTTRQASLYILAVGISHYSDPTYNLIYADKDAHDQISFWESKRQQFGSVKSKAIINEEGTKANILSAKTFLTQAGVDDVVVVFFSGHGLLDQKYDYYFGTSDIDFKNPAVRGLPYEAIEGLLDGIASRKKLLLIDTCHAGEVDRDELAQFTENQGANSSSTRGARLRVRGFAQAQSQESVKSHVGLSPSIELLGDLFADLRRGSGAQVIAAAGGEEFAEEGDDWGNGVFTYAVLEGLRGQADKNKDGTISVSELREYVMDRVSVLTSGGQRPTTREQNLELDFPLIVTHAN